LLTVGNSKYPDSLGLSLEGVKVLTPCRVEQRSKGFRLVNVKMPLLQSANYA
jgi:hypothetical protein